MVEFLELLKSAEEMGCVLVSVNWSTLNGTSVSVMLKEFGSQAQLMMIQDEFDKFTIEEKVVKGGSNFKVWPKDWQLKINRLDFVMF